LMRGANGGNVRGGTRHHKKENQYQRGVSVQGTHGLTH
jgi:hypothetical protein